MRPSFNRREFVKGGAAIAALQALGPCPVFAGSLSSICHGGGAARAHGLECRHLVSALCFQTRSFAGHCYVAPDRSRRFSSYRQRSSYPAFTPGDPHADGFGFPQRFRIEVSDDASFVNSRLFVDCSASDVSEPYDEITEYATGGVLARYVRLTATRLRPAEDGVGYELALAKIDVVSGGKDVAERCLVTADDIFGNQVDLAQITRAPRPMGERTVTDNPGNVIPGDRWRAIPFQANAPLSGVSVQEKQGSSIAPWKTTSATCSLPSR